MVVGVREDLPAPIGRDKKEPPMNANELREKALSMLLPLIRYAGEMTLSPKDTTPGDSRFCSHFNGHPYFNPGKQWPMAPSGKPYDFIFQVVNDGTIGLPQKYAVFQFFYDWHSDPWDTNTEGWLVKTYRDFDPTSDIMIESPLTKDADRKYCDIAFHSIRMLPDWDSIESYSPKVMDICERISEYNPREVYNQLMKELKITTDVESCCGGYPQWIQGDNIGEQKMLFQIGSEKQAGIYWGDAGRVYLFSSVKKSKKGKKTVFHFVMQCH